MLNQRCYSAAGPNRVRSTVAHPYPTALGQRICAAIHEMDPREAIPSLLVATCRNVLIVGRSIPITLVLQSMIGLVRPCSRRDCSPRSRIARLESEISHFSRCCLRSAQFCRSNWSANHLLSSITSSSIENPTTNSLTCRSNSSSRTIPFEME